MYSVVRENNIWHVLKDGRFFTSTHSEDTAQRLAASLNQAKTPAHLRYEADKLAAENGRASKSR